ncbi:unnamed protein product, partial [Medioppia subpectinata]
SVLISGQKSIEINTKHECPICRAPVADDHGLLLPMPNLEVTTIINSLPIHCDNSTIGCEQVLTLDTIAEHLMCPTCGPFTGLTIVEHNCAQALIALVTKTNVKCQTVAAERDSWRLKAEKLDTRVGPIRAAATEVGNAAVEVTANRSQWLGEENILIDNFSTRLGAVELTDVAMELGWVRPRTGPLVQISLRFSAFQKLIQRIHYLVDRRRHSLTIETLAAMQGFDALNPANETECRQLVTDAAVRAPVGGIFCLPPTPESKTSATVRHLDSMSPELCPQLRYFVAFLTADREISSERVCERRRADSLPALAIQWSAADDPKQIRSCLEVLNHFLRVTDETVLSVALKPPEPMGTAPSADGQTLAATAPAGDDRDVVSVIADILGVKDVSKMNASSKLPDLGMDSLMVVTVKQALEDRF